MNDFRYAAAECPLCGKRFTEQDDIVVCPECGAPHHRDCWKLNNGCACVQLHATGQSWQANGASAKMPTENETAEAAAETEAPPPADGLYADTEAEENEEEETESEDSAQQTRTGLCPFCKTQNPPEARFCNACGAPLTPMGNNGPVRVIPFDPLGGLKPEDQIDGVTVRDLAAVVGVGSAYYLPRFKALSEKRRRIQPNLTAFFFDFAWMLYRKMTLQGIGVLLLHLALELPQAAYLLFDKDIGIVSEICFYLSYVVQFAVALFGNTVYMKVCLQRARQLRAVHPDDAEFQKAAAEHCGVRQKLLGVFIVLYGIGFAASTLALFIL